MKDTNTKYCEFGCGNIAIHQFKTSKKWCCSLSANKCPSMRTKNSLGKIGKVPNWKNGNPRGMKDRRSWNSGFTKETHPNIKKSSETQKLHYKLGIIKHVLPSPENEKLRRLKISEWAKKNGSGGYKRGSGRGKKGWYCEYWCDSSWELAWVIYNLEHNILFKRNHKKFQYIYGGKIRNWLPDFIMEDGLYVEIKGYLSDQANSKIKQFNEKMLVIDKNSIQPYLEYVTSKYGKDFTKLYKK